MISFEPKTTYLTIFGQNKQIYRTAFSFSTLPYATNIISLRAEIKKKRHVRRKKMFVLVCPQAHLNLKWMLNDDSFFP